MSNKFHNKKGFLDNYVPPYDAALLAEPIESAGFSEEVATKLRNGKVTLLLDLAVRTEKDMYKITTFNKKNLFEVKRVLQMKHLDFRPSPAPEAGAEGQTQPAQSPDRRNQGNRPISDRGNQSFIERPSQGKNQNPQGQGDRQNAGSRPSDRLPSERQNQNGRPQQGERQNAGNRSNPNNRDSKDNRPRDNRQDQQSNRPGIKNDRPNNQPRDSRAGVLPKQAPTEDAGRPNPKQLNKRIWDTDGISEQRTKEEKEKKRPAKPVVTMPKDIYIKINKNDKWGFADRNGKEIVPPVYDEVYSYKEDLCCVEKDGLFGYIDREGREVIPIMYDCAMSFSEGLACVCKNNRCGYIDKNNEVKIEFRFDAGTPMIDGNCRVKKDGKWGELFLDNPNEIRWIV